jgi:hypothetical protein
MTRMEALFGDLPASLRSGRQLHLWKDGNGATTGSDLLLRSLHKDCGSAEVVCVAGHPHHGRRQVQRQQEAVPASQRRDPHRAGDAAAATSPLAQVRLSSRKASNSLSSSSSGAGAGGSWQAVADPHFHRRPPRLRRRTSSSPSRMTSTGRWCGPRSCKTLYGQLAEFPRQGHIGGASC